MRPRVGSATNWRLVAEHGQSCFPGTTTPIYSDAVRAAMANLHEAQKFTVEYELRLKDDAVSRYAIDLAKSDLLALPHDHCYFEWPDPDPQDPDRRGFAVVVCQRALLTVQEMARNAREAATFPAYRTGGDTSVRDVSMETVLARVSEALDGALVANPTLGASSTQVERWMLTGGVISPRMSMIVVQDRGEFVPQSLKATTEQSQRQMICYLPWSPEAVSIFRKHGENIERLSNNMMQDAATTVSAVLNIIAFMTTRGAEKDPIVSDNRSNRRLRRIGAKPTVSHHLLRIRSVSKSAATSSARSGNDDVWLGERASPRMHWRRGHVRHHATGISLVRPCLVNATGDGFADKTYVVA